MTQATEAALSGIVTVVKTVIVNMPNYPPEQANYTPIAVPYIVSGILANGPTGTRMDLWRIAIDVLLPYTQLLDNALQTLTPMLDTVPAALQKEVSSTTAGSGGQFGGTIETFARTVISYIPKTDYAGVEMRGYRFELEDVKILVNT